MYGKSNINSLINNANYNNGRHLGYLVFLESRATRMFNTSGQTWCVVLHHVTTYIGAVPKSFYRGNLTQGLKLCLIRADWQKYAKIFYIDQCLHPEFEISSKNQLKLVSFVGTAAILSWLQEEIWYVIFSICCGKISIKLPNGRLLFWTLYTYNIFTEILLNINSEICLMSWPFWKSENRQEVWLNWLTILFQFLGWSILMSIWEIFKKLWRGFHWQHLFCCWWTTSSANWKEWPLLVE